MMGDLEVAFQEVAATALGLPPFSIKARLEEPPPGAQGAYLALVTGQSSIQIGIASDEAGCQALAKGLLSMTEADPPLAAPELADAFCEIVNIVAGAFKSRVRERLGSLSMGLPIFFHGPAQATEHTAVQVTVVEAGASTAALLLVYPRSHGHG